MILGAKHKMDRKHTGFRLHSCRVSRRGDAEVDIASPQLLQYLRLLAQLRPRELVDDHRPAAQLLQLVGKGVGGDPVGRGMRLVIGEAEMPCLGSYGARPGRIQRTEQYCEEDGFAVHMAASL